MSHIDPTIAKQSSVTKKFEFIVLMHLELLETLLIYFFNALHFSYYEQRPIEQL